MQSTIHEIRNQLAVAVANIEAFIDGKFKVTPDRLNSVLQALMEVDVLINDLRPAVLAIPPTALLPVDVCGLILSELVAIEATAAAAGIDVRVERCATSHPACTTFMCDRGQVSQIVKNVLLNAVKYTPRGGHIVIDCHREPGVMALEISDDGPGVLPEERELIFATGTRGSAAGTSSGSGIGLAIVKRIVDTHGGSIDVDRSELGGARFVIRLPGSTLANDTCRTCAPLDVKTPVAPSS